MKKKILFVTLLLVMIFTTNVFAIDITIDGERVIFDKTLGQPFIDENGRTQVPLRVTMESFGVALEWDNGNRKAVVKDDNTTVEVPILDVKTAKPYIIVNGDIVEIDTFALIKDGRIYLPIRAVVEAFGATVKWDGEKSTVFIDKTIKKYFDISKENFDEVFFIDEINKNLNNLYEYVDILDNNCEKYVPTENYEYIDLKSNEFYDDGRFINKMGTINGIFIFNVDYFEYFKLYQHYKDVINSIYGVPQKTDEATVYNDNSYSTSWENIRLEYIYYNDIKSEIRLYIEPSKYRSVPLDDEINNDNYNYINVEINESINGVLELKNYLEKYYSKLYTPVGEWEFTFTIYENDKNIFPQDYSILVGWENLDGVSPYDLKYSIKISNEDKEKTMQLLTQYQKEIASVAMQALPNKKIMGEFYEGFYKYPYLKVGYETIEFLEWRNYNDAHYYEDAKITHFQWAESYNNDYDFLREVNNEITVEDNNDNYKQEIINNSWDKSPSETTGYEWQELSIEQKKILIEKAVNELEDEGYTISQSIDWLCNTLNKLYNDNSLKFITVKNAIFVESNGDLDY